MSKLPKYFLKNVFFLYFYFCVLFNRFRRINMRYYFSKFGKFNSERQLPLAKFTKLTFFDSKLVKNSIFPIRYEKNINCIRFLMGDLGRKDNKINMSEKPISQKNEGSDYLSVGPLWRQKKFSF